MMQLFFTAFFLTCEYAYSQNFKVQKFDEKDGLIQTAIYGLGQDEDGSIWIGTDIGLYRYDGVSFTNFGVQDGLHDYEIFGLSFTKADRAVVCAHSGKLNYIVDGSIQGSDYDPVLARINLGSIPVGQTIDTSSVMLFGKDRNFIYKAHFQKNKPTEIERFDLPGGNVLVDAEYRKNRFAYLGLRFENNDYIGSLNSFEIDKGKVTYSVDVGTRSGHLRFIDDNHVLVHDSNYRLLVFDLNKKGPPTSLGKLKTTNINEVEVLNANHFFFATTEGLFEYKNGVIKHHLYDMVVNTIYTDRDSNLWVGTLNNGLYLLTKTSPFHYSAFGSDQNLGIFCLSGRADKKIIGMGNMHIGLLKAGRIEKLRIRKKNQNNHGSRVMDIEYIDDKTVVIGTDHGAFLYTAYDHNKLENIIYDEPNLSIKDVEVDSGRIWIAFHNGLTSTDCKLRDSRTHLVGRITCIAFSDRNTIWFSRHTGLYKYHIDSGIVDTIPGPFEETAIRNIAYDNGFMYLATGLGVYRVNTDNYSVTHFLDGLSSSNCLKVYPKNGVIWAASHFGLNKITPDGNSYQVTNYSTDHGLASNRVSDVYIYRDTIWVVTARGICRFLESDLQAYKPLGVNILGFASESGQWNPDSNITLASNDRNLTIRYVAPVYGQSLYYEYRLLPGDRDWTRTNQTAVSFSGLNSGDHTFEVRNVNQDGSLTGETQYVRFRIKPKLHEMLAVQILVVIAILGLILGLTYNHTRRIKARERKKRLTEKQLASMELEAIKAQINPHFVYNCLNSIRFSVLNGHVERAEEQISVFARLIRKTLDFSKLDFIPLSEELDYLEQYTTMEKIRFKEHLNVSLISHPDLNGFMVPTMMIQPFVENAVKHGMKGLSDEVLQVDISFKRKDNYLQCKIEDSGPGISVHLTKSECSNHGMELSNTRAATYNMLYGTDIKIFVKNKSVEGLDSSGTIVTIYIPQVTAKRKTYENIYHRRRGG